jgi:iron complex outermembrane receptor protein
LNDRIELSGRLSRITSDGYIDRAASELESYFLQGAYKDDNTLVKALLFGGNEITYQSWFGFDASTIAAIGEDSNLDTNRTFNIGGIQFDEDGNFEGFYENQVDNYKQDHVQLLWNEQISGLWSSNIALHFTRGRGFFEEYIDDWYYTNILFSNDPELSFIGRDNFTLNGEAITSTDYTRRRWLDNDFYGTVFSANYRNEDLDIISGGGWNKYEGAHFGEVLWARLSGSSEVRDRYYDNDSKKTDFNIFTKVNYHINDRLSLFGDLQLRSVSYEANGQDTGLVDDSFNFFNPKAGITYNADPNHNFYFSYAVANREPNRNDYENGNPKPERLNDFELGWRYLSPSIRVNTSLYFMKYKDQLVLTGELNDVGAPLRANVGDSYRLGLEADAAIKLGNQFIWHPNIALSSNKNVDFIFERDGVLQELGNTNIAFSPAIVLGNRMAYAPWENLELSLLTKYVGKQYLGNIDAESSVLEAYSQSDFNIQYEISTNSFIKSIVVSGLVNNIFNAKYVSNGYFYTFDDDFSNPGTITTIEGTGYYPQAGINFLLGASLNF